MVDVDELRMCLCKLHEHNNTKCVREAVETLLKIHRNILQNEYNMKYRKIKPQNPAFHGKVWSVEHARRFMTLCGWLQVADVLVFNNDEYLDDILSTLIEHRFVVPATYEWQEESKFENITDPQLREEELRGKAALDRQKELAEFKADKLYREQLNETVKAKIAEDRKRNQNRYTQPVVGNTLKGTARVRSLQSSPSTGTTRRLGG